MSPDNEVQARGQLVTDYLNAKNKLIALESDARRLIGQLQQLASQLTNYETAPANYDTKFLQRDFQQLLNDLRTTAQEKVNLAQKLRSLGMDIIQ